MLKEFDASISEKEREGNMKIVFDKNAKDSQPLDEVKEKRDGLKTADILKSDKVASERII